MMKYDIKYPKGTHNFTGKKKDTEESKYTLTKYSHYR